MNKIFTNNNSDINFLILKVMKRIREVELSIAKNYSHQLMRCPVHLSIGQEAPSAALSLLIKSSDFSVSTHRGHAHYLAKGGNLKAMIAELYGKSTGCSKGKGGSMHLIDTSVRFMGTSAIVGNSIPTGTGLAMAAKLRKRGEISVIHMGDGAVEEGAFYESLNFAVLHNLPALYLCENNFYSVYSPLEVRQPKNRLIYQLAKSIGSHAFFGDGNDPLNCYNIINEAISICREKSFPVFIELETYRWLEHCGPNDDDNLNYRKNDEIQFWKEKDPIINSKNKLSKSELAEYENYCIELDRNILEAFNFALSSNPPDKSTIYEDIYS